MTTSEACQLEELRDTLYQALAALVPIGDTISRAVLEIDAITGAPMAGGAPPPALVHIPPQRLPSGHR